MLNPNCKMSIIIFSRPIHSGKTTALLQWSNEQKNILGILMPDINGSRKILDIQTNAVFDIECTDADHSNEHLTSVGKFHFYTAAFAKANLVISNALAQKPDWLVIDEAGKLELDGNGFYPAIKEAARLYSNSNNSGTLLITVRDSLCADVIKFFKMKNCKVVHRIEDI